MDKKIKIAMLGKFEIMIGGEVVLLQLNQLRKSRLFLEYLILKKDRDVTQNEIIDVLWADGESTNPTTALRTMLHRFRTMVDNSEAPALRDIIVVHRGIYRLNPNFNYEIDVFELERLSGELGAEGLSPAAKLERCYKILDLYKGPLLPDLADEKWLQPKSAQCHTLFLDAVYTAVDILKQQDKFDKVVEVCRRAGEIDGHDERINLELVNALVKTGKNRDAFKRLQQTEANSSGENGAEFNALYRRMMNSEQKLGGDIEQVVAELMATAQPRGAFVCSYEVFKDMYQIECRLLERQNTPMFLALLALENTVDVPPETLRIEGAMSELLETVTTNLRRGDIVARYSARQYVVLLANVSNETCEMVMERVKAAFYEKSQMIDLKLRYRIRQVGSARRSAALTASAPI